MIFGDSPNQSFLLYTTILQKNQNKQLSFVFGTLQILTLCFFEKWIRQGPTHPEDPSNILFENLEYGINIYPET